MSIQFPDAPAQGDSFVATNGVSYTYDNGGWIANSQSALDDRFVNLDGDSMTGDLTVPSLNGGPLAGFRNQVINGSFQCWQRSLGITSVGSAYKTADRWYIETNGINTVSQRIDIDNTTNALKDEAPTTYGMRLHANGAPLEARQCIELEKTGAAGIFKPGTKWFISWYSDLRNGSTGNDGTFINCRVAFMDDASDPGVNTEIIRPLVNLGGRRWGFPIEIQSTPPSSATCLRIDLITANVNEFEFTGIQLEPGPVATPFEHRPIQTELALCQRYYEIGREEFLAARIDTGSGYYSNYWRRPWKVTKRGVPTITYDMEKGGSFSMSGTTEEFNCGGYVYGDEKGATAIAFTFIADAEL